MPRERTSIKPADSSLRKALTITERVMPTLSATLEATSKPSLAPNSSKICSTASSSEKDSVSKAMETTERCLAPSSTSSTFALSSSIPITVALTSANTKSLSSNSLLLDSISVPRRSPPPKIGITVVNLLVGWQVRSQKTQMPSRIILTCGSLIFSKSSFWGPG